jgi:hypothetical protein
MNTESEREKRKCYVLKHVITNIQENQQGLEMDGTYQFLSRTDVNLSSENANKVRDQSQGLVTKVMNFIHHDDGDKRNIRNVGVYRNHDANDRPSF